MAGFLLICAHTQSEESSDVPASNGSFQRHLKSRGKKGKQILSHYKEVFFFFFLKARHVY